MLTGFDRDQCYMNCDPPISRPTAVGDCLTNWTSSSAPPMPYNGGRAAHALRASLADDGRGAYVKWRLRLRSSASTAFYLPFRHRRRRIKTADEQSTPLPLPYVTAAIMFLSSRVITYLTSSVLIVRRRVNRYVPNPAPAKEK
jgi:hypothetical protein